MRPRALSLAAVLAVALGATGCAHRVAVLASVGLATASSERQSTEFWTDTVLTYCKLLQNGYAPENIVVLYGDGVDYVDTGGELPAMFRRPYCDGSIKGDYRIARITDIAITDGLGNKSRDRFCDVMCCLAGGRPSLMVAPAQGDDLTRSKCECCTRASECGSQPSCGDLKVNKLKGNDVLTLWVKGHGSVADCDTSLLFGGNGTVKDTELKKILSDLRAGRRLLVFETCHSGGWLDEFENDTHTVALASSGNRESTNCVERSFPTTYPYDDKTVLHGRFSYWFNRGWSVSVDQDGRSTVHASEVFDFVEGRIGLENGEITYPVEPTRDLGGVMTPDMVDAGGNARTFLLPPQDSEGSGWVMQPEGSWRQGEAMLTVDLWLSAEQTCEWPKLDSIRAGEAAYLCVEVQNGGPRTNPTVKLNLGVAAPNCKVSDDYQSEGLLDLESGAAVLVTQDWTAPDVASPTTYCFAAMIDHCGDSCTYTRSDTVTVVASGQ